nr:hypothetical protein [Tanacetum cinerariifolium]
MGRDTIQLENVVSTISQEYLMEFTSEYGILEGLHSKLPGPEETIMDFLEDKVGVYTKFFEFVNFRGREDISYCRGLVHKRSEGWDASNKLVLRGERDITEHTPYPHPKTTRSPVMPSRAEPEILSGGRLPRIPPRETVYHREVTARLCQRRPALNNYRGGRAEDQVQDEVAYEVPLTGNTSATGVALETCLEKEVAAMRPSVNKRRRKRGKSLASMRLDADSLLSTPATHDPSTATKSVSDPKPLSYTNPLPHSEKDIAQSSKGMATEILTEDAATTEVNIQYFMRSLELGRSSSVPSMVGSPGVTMGSQLRLRFKQEVRLLKKARSKIARRDQRIQVREEEIKKLDQEMHGLQNQTKNLKTLLEAEVDMKKYAKAKNAELAKELDNLRIQFSDLQVSNKQLFDLILNLQAQVMGEAKIKAAFKEFKKYEDDKVEQRCAKMDARLDKLSVDFDEELYPHMLT